MFSQKIAVLAIIAGALIGGSANAQETEKYLTVGTNTEGNPIALNTQDIEGTDFKLLSIYGETVTEITLHASCGDSRLFISKTANYSKSGQTLAEDETQKEISFKAETPAGKAMIFVCRSVGARGW